MRLPRPLRRYYLVFVHPGTGKAIRTYTTGQTPCLAKQMGWNQLERLKAVDPEMPRDNTWRLETQRDEGIVGIP